MGGHFLDSLAPPWLWPPSELRCFRCVWAQGLVWLDGLGCRPSGGEPPSAPWPVTACTQIGETCAPDCSSGVRLRRRNPIQPVVSGEHSHGEAGFFDESHHLAHHVVACGCRETEASIAERFERGGRIDGRRVGRDDD